MAEAEIHREIEGGNAGFIAGCVLSNFDINPSVRITNKLSIKSDANTILVSWRQYKDLGPSQMKGILQSVAGPLRFCHRSSATLRGRWQMNTIAGFYQPEHAHAALRHFNGTLDVEVSLVYTVYFTASKELADAVLLNVEEIIPQITDAQIIWEEPRNGMVTLRLAGTRQKEIVLIKQIFESIFAGRVAITGFADQHHEIWHNFFATPSGDIWLQHLARDINLIIISDKLQQRLRIYEQLDEATRVVLMERQLIEKVSQLDTRRETFSIQLDYGDYRKIIASDFLAKMQAILGKENLSLDILKKKLVMRCTPKIAQWIRENVDETLPPPSASMLASECPQCGDNTLDVKYSTCDHVICRDCFNHQIQVASSDLTSSHFPLVCWHENCKQPISIPDLRRYVTGTKLDALLRASLTYYIRSFPHIYRNCRTPDCKSVYLRHGSYEIFTCPTCLTQTCTTCHAEPHLGWTCAEFESHLRERRRNENLLDGYKELAGTKDCPKCSTLIEKVDGCHHVECSGCHGHICWVCLKVFDQSVQAYEHMNISHGGNGLENGEDDDDEVRFHEGRLRLDDDQLGFA